MDIEAITTGLYGRVLSGLSLRQAALTQNLVHQNTPGYQPVKVSFNDALLIARTEVERQSRVSPETMSAISPRIEHDTVTASTTMPREPDLLLAELNSNAGRYQTLIKLLNRHFSMMSIAASDGKR